MRARVELVPEQFINFNSGSVEVHCLACNSWVSIDEVQEVIFEDGCRMSECPKCRALSMFEKDMPLQMNSEYGRRRSEFELTPAEARDKILRILLHMPKEDRERTTKELKDAL